MPWPSGMARRAQSTNCAFPSEPDPIPGPTRITRARNTSPCRSTTGRSQRSALEVSQRDRQPGANPVAGRMISRLVVDGLAGSGFDMHESRGRTTERRVEDRTRIRRLASTADQCAQSGSVVASRMHGPVDGREAKLHGAFGVRHGRPGDWPDRPVGAILSQIQAERPNRNETWRGLW